MDDHTSLRQLRRLEQDIYGITDRDHLGLLVNVIRSNPDPAGLDRQQQGVRYAYFAVNFGLKARELDISKYAKHGESTQMLSMHVYDWLIAACDVSIRRVEREHNKRSFIAHLQKLKADLLSEQIKWTDDVISQKIKGKRLLRSLEASLDISRTEVIPEVVNLAERIGRSYVRYAGLFSKRPFAFEYLISRSLIAYDDAIQIASGLDGAISPDRKLALFRKASDAAESIAWLKSVRKEDWVDHAVLAAAYCAQADRLAPGPDLAYKAMASMMNAGRLYMLAYLEEPTKDHFDKGLICYQGAVNLYRHNPEVAERQLKSGGLYRKLTTLVKQLEKAPRRMRYEIASRCMEDFSLRAPLLSPSSPR